MNLTPYVPIKKNEKKCYLTGWSTLSHAELAEAMKSNNGGNVGLRLDQYMALDPDCPEAEKFCMELDADGELPTTLTFKSASGYTVRLYNPPPGRHKPIHILNPFELEIRTGSGQLCVLPPSVVAKNKHGQPGKYEWLPGHSPKDIEPADFPLELLERLRVIEEQQNRSATGEERAISNLSFEKGNRDESIFSVALALRKGGMSEADILAAVEAIGKGCGFTDREIAAKVRSAMKETPGERNFKAEIELWIDNAEGVFTTNDIDRDLVIITKSDKSARRMTLKRLCDKNIIKRIPDRPGMYSKIDSGLKRIDYKSADPHNLYDIKLPLSLHKLVNTYPKNIIIVGGSSNAGKTAFMLNVVKDNLKNHKIRYLSSEMGDVELRIRLEDFGIPLEYWDSVDFFERNNDFASAIDPEGLNIVDYLELSDNFYQVGSEIRAIFDNLTTGICIIGIQKKEGSKYARGGEFTMEKARLYVTIDYDADKKYNILKIIKAKNRVIRTKRPEDISYTFNIFGGWEITNIKESSDDWI